VFLAPTEIFVEVLAEFDFERVANTSHSPLDNILLLLSSQIIINYQEQIIMMKTQFLKLTEIRGAEADIEVAMHKHSIGV